MRANSVSTCTKCNRVFHSTYAFDAHRIGHYGLPVKVGEEIVGYTPPERRCMTLLEMQAAGMKTDANGHWRTARRKDANIPWAEQEAA